MFRTALFTQQRTLFISPTLGIGKAGRSIRVNPRVQKIYSQYKLKKNMRSVEVWETMSVQDLARNLDVPVDDLFDEVLNLDPSLVNHLKHERQPIRDKRTIGAIAKKLEFRTAYVKPPNTSLEKLFEPEEEAKSKDVTKAEPANPKDLIPRPPCVAIMGHIDHGKTSLLDYLRKSQIVAGEHGGITQHIGAFQVELGERKVTFIDTPGHAAFKQMRSRGANTTDIVILVVDGCEGVLEQSLESLRMIRQAKVPYMVAINKIDKPGIDIKSTKAQLTNAGVHLEENGGDVQCVPISALKGTNVMQLVEAILTQAEMMELKADFKGNGEGVVIESQVEQGLGKTATVLVQRGTLKPGDHIVSGLCHCKIRLLLDDKGNKLTKLKPSEAAKVVGWKDIPTAGGDVIAVGGVKEAKTVIDWRKQEEMRILAESQVEVIQQARQADREVYSAYRENKLSIGVLKPRWGTCGRIRNKETEEEDETPTVNVIVKGDVDGSVEAILSCLDTYVSDEVKLDIVNFGIGEVSDTDVSLAQRFDAIIYAFNTTISPEKKKIATAANVSVKEFNVIYHLIADLKNEISDRLKPADIEDVTGRANVLQEFLVSDRRSKVPVAGCRVLSGKLSKAGRHRVIRGDSVLWEGSLASIKHLKDEVSEVVQGQECGVRLVEEGEENLRFEAGDQIVMFTVRQEARWTDWNPGF